MHDELTPPPRSVQELAALAFLRRLCDRRDAALAEPAVHERLPDDGDVEPPDQQ